MLKSTLTMIEYCKKKSVSQSRVVKDIKFGL